MGIQKTTHLSGRKYKISDGKSNFVKDESLVKDIVKKYRDNFPIVYGVPRSGSTLVRNILNTIFDGNIKVQQHNFFNTNKKVICAYRDFRDSAASKWRINKAGFDNEKDLIKINFEGIKPSAKAIKTQVEKNLNMFKFKYSEDQIYFARYEDYHNNFDVLCNDLENFLDIQIKKDLREFLKQTWSKERIKKVYSNALPKFKGFDSETEIHGQHIYKGKVGTWKEFVVEKDHDKFSNFFRKELIEWNYKI